MPICVIVLKQNLNPTELSEKLMQSSDRLSNCQLVSPSQAKGTKVQKASKESLGGQELKLKPCQINDVKLLNPKLERKARQKAMAFWLMPFGFVAGLSFTKMTGLTTFENLGVGTFGETLIGSLLGMGSGLIGSFAASGSEDKEVNKDIQNLRKKNEAGKWLLILETPLDIELPWYLINKINPIEVVRLNQL